MNNSHLTNVLETLNPAPGFKPWHGGPTLPGALRGVKAGQAVWKPAHDRHSIWELALHIACWRYSVRRYFDPDSNKGFPRSPASFPKISDPSEKAWKKDKLLISEEHDKLMRAIHSFPDNRLHEQTDTSKGWSYSQLLVGITVHDAYHIGQIQLMKRLYNSMNSDK